MHVPLVIVGPGVAPGVSDAPVSARRVFHTILDWAALGDEHSLRGPGTEIVLGEAMKPFLSYGWQPQVMAVEGRTKAILSGRLEVYDVRRRPVRVPRPRREGAGLTAPAHGPARVPGPVSRGPARRGGAGGRGAAPAGEPRLRLRRVGARRAEGRSAPGRHDPPLRHDRQGVRPLRPRGVRAGRPAAREDPGGGPGQPRRGPASRHRPLHARAGGARAPRVRESGRNRPGIAGRQDLPRAPLRAGEGLGARGAAARAGGGRVARPPPRGRGPGARPGAAGPSRGGARARPAGLRAPEALAGGARPPRRARHGGGQDPGRPRVVRERTGRPRRRLSERPGARASSISPSGASTRRGRRSTAFPPRTPGTRWRSSSGRR